MQAKEVQSKARATCFANHGVEHSMQDPAVVAKSQETHCTRYKEGNASRTDEVKAKTRATCLAKYGVEHAGQAVEVKQHSRDTCVAKYGVEHSWQAEAVKQRIRDTCLARYGATSAQHTPEVRAKTAATNQARYGGPSPFSSSAVTDKARTTCETRFGTPNAAQSETVKARTLASNLAKYGVVQPMCLEATQAKARATNLAKYGHENPSKCPTIVTKILESQLRNHGTTSPWAAAKRNGTTKQQKVTLFLNELGFDFKEAVIPGPVSLDGLDVVTKTAFEFNGLRWHCEDSPEPRRHDYHRRKLRICREHGIRLFSIFEDEWDLRQEQVKGFLRAALGKNSRKLYARKTEVREISDKEAQDFYESYHVQGRTSKNACSAGLFCGGELVAAMSFGSHPHRRDVLTSVLTRLCFKSDTSVTGGSAKLFKFLAALTKTDEVISWSDNRWSEGGVYKALGFVNDKELEPDYQYVKLSNPTKRFAKQGQRKTAAGCPEHLTELQWAKERGLSRIWDCGKIRWKWTASKAA